MDPRLNRLLIYLSAIPILYLVICTVLYFRQDDLVFCPVPVSATEEHDLAVAKGFAPWMNAAGQQIGWQSLKGDPANCWLVVHGNGGYALQRSYYRHYAKDSGDPKVYLLEYPGYGDRGGKPSEQSLTAAALEGIDLLSSDPQRRIWLLGESLGSGVASAAAGLRPDKIAGVLLVTPYNSLTAAASAHYPWIPVSLLLHTRFDSEANLRHFSGPVAFVVGEEDTIVPARLGVQLYDGYSGRKHLWRVPQADHNVTQFLLANWPQLWQWLQGQP